MKGGGVVDKKGVEEKDTLWMEEHEEGREREGGREL